MWVRIVKNILGNIEKLHGSPTRVRLFWGHPHVQSANSRYSSACIIISGDINYFFKILCYQIAADESGTQGLIWEKKL